MRGIDGNIGRQNEINNLPQVAAHPPAPALLRAARAISACWENFKEKVRKALADPMPGDPGYVRFQIREHEWRKGGIESRMDTIIKRLKGDDRIEMRDDQVFNDAFLDDGEVDLYPEEREAMNRVNARRMREEIPPLNTKRFLLEEYHKLSGQRERINQVLEGLGAYLGDQPMNEPHALRNPPADGELHHEIEREEGEAPHEYLAEGEAPHPNL